MKTLYHFIIIIVILFCPFSMQAQKSIYTFPFENSYRLPVMHKTIKMDEISSTYQTMGNIYTTEITGFGDKYEQTSMSFISDAKVVDAVRFLEFYMEEQLITTGEDPSGEVEMSIIYYHEHYRFSFGSVIGILTMGIGTLCGVPFSTAIVDVEIEASFFDDSEIPFAKHRGVGRGKKPQSIYSTSTRKAHQRAIKKAIVDLNKDIMADPVLLEIPLTSL